MTQWHPLFAKLLRPVVEDYFDVQTNVPVGDLPRQADIVLLRRTSSGALPFRGLWKDLTTWNVLEFKGPTVSARPADLDVLVELGLGIHRRLNEERVRQQRKPLSREQISFWYLANALGRRFLSEAERLFGSLETERPGIWRCRALRRLVFLVSASDLPVEAESLPLHVLSKESPDKELAMARLVLEQPDLWRHYGQVLTTLHPATLEEIRAMVRTKNQAFKFHVEPLIELMGMEELINQLGLKRVIDEVGVKRVIDEVGVKRVIDEIGLDDLLQNLTAAQRRELKRKLQ
jgi:hypothetical protein